MDNSLKYTCLFGGGAIRGTAYVGAVKALEELSVTPVNIAGSSVGSIVAALVALGYSAEELRNAFLDVNFDLFSDFQFTLGPKMALSKGELFLEWIRELIEKKYYGENYQKGRNKAVTFKDIEKNLIIITTDISNFVCKEFSKYETPDFEIATAIRISCSMPGLMSPFEYNNTLLVDGDLQKCIPMWKLSKNLVVDNERVLEFRLEGDFDGTDKNVLDYMNTVYTCVTSMGTAFIAETFGGKDKFDYIVINTGGVIVVDFNYPREKREELIESGYRQTMSYFTKKLPQKKTELLDKYLKLNKHITQAKKFLDNNKILKSKNELTEMFVNLCEIKDFIDKKVYVEVKELYDEFTQSIKYPALFGKISIKNKSAVTEKFTAVAQDISGKISELQDYLLKYPI